jgi:hypothetical protein
LVQPRERIKITGEQIGASPSGISITWIALGLVPAEILLITKKKKGTGLIRLLSLSLSLSPSVFFFFSNPHSFSRTYLPAGYAWHKLNVEVHGMWYFIVPAHTRVSFGPLVGSRPFHTMH